MSKQTRTGKRVFRGGVGDRAKGGREEDRTNWDRVGGANSATGKTIRSGEGGVRKGERVKVKYEQEECGAGVKPLWRGGRENKEIDGVG